jgi:protein TonB
MPAGRRFTIATAFSLGFHVLAVTLIGILTGRMPVRPPILIPIELTVTEGAAGSLELGPGGHPEVAQTQVRAASTKPQRKETKPASRGGDAKAAAAAPKILTSNKGAEPAGPETVGKEQAGAGGREEAPAGPSRGPGIVPGPVPTYPKDALDRGLEGSVTLSVLVAEGGSISSVSVTRSSGRDLLDEAAVRAVKTGWTFEPALKNGRPAPGKVDITFGFAHGTVKRK